MRNVTSSGQSPLPAQPSAQEVPCTPDELWGQWMSKMPYEDTDVSHALHELAHGRPAKDNFVELALYWLLEAEAYPEYLAVFEAHHAAKEAAAGEPVRRELSLTLPLDWNPNHAKLEAMFKALRVDSLILDGRASDFTAHACHCIALLIEGGLKELSICGSLADPQVVAQAFKHGALRSIAFWGPSISTGLITKPLDVDTLVTARVLLEGLLDSPKLESLAIHDHHLLAMPSLYEKLLSNLPALQSLEISLRRPNFTEHPEQTVKKFMELVRASKAFSSIALTARPDIDGLHARNVWSAILEPLHGHPRLSSLELRHMPGLIGHSHDLKTQGFATAFAASCAQLTYFAWEADASALSVGTFRTLVRGGSDLDRPEESMGIVSDGVKSLSRMKKMVMVGHPCTIGSLNALAQARGDVDSSMDLDLRQSLLDAKAAIDLAAAWKKGKLKGNLLLPASFDRYYLRVEGHIWGIAENATRTGFVLSQDGTLDQPTSNRAVAAFEALKPALLELIRQQLVHSTAPLLESNVQAFMQAALRSAKPEVEGVGDDAFSLPAAAIVQQLLQEERTPTLVRLAAVNADMHNVQQASFAKLDVADGHIQQRSDIEQMARLENARHAGLMAAVEKLDLIILDGLLRKGAVDIGGRAFQRARELYGHTLLWPQVSEVFASHTPRPASPPTKSNSSNSSNNSNSDVTTTTTTTLTTGTLGTSTPSTQTAIMLDTPDRSVNTWRQNVRFRAPTQVPQSKQTLGTSAASAQVEGVVETPEKKADRWIALREKSRHPMPSRLMEALQDFARGVLPTTRTAQKLFLDLLNVGSFDLFVEVFQTYSGNLRTAAQDLHNPSFKSSLVLELDHGWAPDIAQMNLALQRIQVDTLTLTPTSANPHLSSTACHLVATLLKGGTTELRLGGVPSYPQLMTEAMPRSQLRSLTLLGVPKWSHFLEAQSESFEALALGSAKCTALKEVVIRDEKIFAVFVPLLYTRPKLTSLGVSLGDSMERSRLTQFMERAGELSTLSRVKVHFDVLDVKDLERKKVEHVGMDRVQAAIFNRLAGSKSLTSLDMGPMPMNVDSPVCTGAAPKALVFTGSHPSLKQFSWQAVPSEPLTVQHLRDFHAAGGDLDMAETSTHIARAHAQGGSNLEELALSGLVLLPGPTQAWAATLADNRSLRRVDLNGCLMDARTAAMLRSAMQQNPLIERIAVSADYRHYYFSFEGHICSIRLNSSGDGLDLTRVGQPDEALDERIAQAFGEVENGLRELIVASLKQTLQDTINAQR